MLPRARTERQNAALGEALAQDGAPPMPGLRNPMPKQREKPTGGATSVMSLDRCPPRPATRLTTCGGLPRPGGATGPASGASAPS
jgi:hypothetical protein